MACISGGRLMEAIGMGIVALGKAIGSIAAWGGLSIISAVMVSAFLIYTDKISLDDIKSFFNKRGRY